MQTNAVETQTSALDALHAANASGKAPGQAGAVSRDSFLNLLVTQLRNQDPLDPVQNTEFISQLATFQSLESQIASSKHLEDLVAIQESQLGLAGLSQAALLVGKKVTWTDAEGKDGSGLVMSVTVENGVMMINHEKGKVPVGALTSIALPTPTTSSGATSDAGEATISKAEPDAAPTFSTNS